MFWPKVIFICFHSLMFGVGLSALGPYLVKGNVGSILHDIDLEETWKQSLATALTLLGAMISALTTSIPTNHFGNKKMLIINSCLWIIGGLCCLPYNLYSLLVGRFITGLGVGFSSTLAPVLLSEISHPQQKGFVTSMHQVSITFGIFVMGVLSKWMVNIEHGWWWINSVTFIIIGFIMVITGLSIPESPFWLLKNGKNEEAAETLRSLRGEFDYNEAHRIATAAAINSDVSSPLLGSTTSNITSSSSPNSNNRITSGLDSYDLDHLQGNNMNDHELALNLELQEMTNQMKSSSTSEVSWGEIFTSRYRNQILMGTCLMLSSALVGINAVTMFTTKIFSFAGLDEEKAIYGTMAAATASFLSSFISMLTIERLGRRSLFITGAIGCVVSLIVLSCALLLLNSHASLQGTIAVVGIIAYILSFNYGLGGVPWALLPEISASKIRGKLQSLFCFQNWLGNFIIVLSTLPLVELLGGGDSEAEEKKGAAILFLIYAIFAFLALCFGIFFLIETKGLSEATIQLKLGNDEGTQATTIDSLNSSETYQI